MSTEKDICEICGAELTPENKSKSYRHRCKNCVARLAREKRELEKTKVDFKELLDDFKQKIKIQLCGGRLPVKKHVGDACYDLYVPEDYELKDGRQIIPLGFKIQLPHGFCAQIRPRSGYSSQGLEIKGTDARHDADVITGIVDENYRGEVGVIIVNHKWRVMNSENKFVHPVVAKGTRIAQMQIVRVPETDFEIVESLDEDENRGENGFGSSNKKRV